MSIGGVEVEIEAAEVKEEEESLGTPPPPTTPHPDEMKKGNCGKGKGTNIEYIEPRK